jgi:hypothetical protein
MKKRVYIVTSDIVNSDDQGNTCYLSFTKKKALEFFRRRFIKANKHFVLSVIPDSKSMDLDSFVNKYNGIIAFELNTYHFGSKFVTD